MLYRMFCSESTKKNSLSEPGCPGTITASVNPCQPDGQESRLHSFNILWTKKCFAEFCKEISCRFQSPTLTDLMNHSMSLTICMFYPESTNIGLFLLLHHNLQPSLLFIGIPPHVPYLWVFVEHSSDSNDCWKISNTSESYSLDIIQKWHSDTGYPELWLW